jgi:hypothetical protein
VCRSTAGSDSSVRPKAESTCAVDSGLMIIPNSIKYVGEHHTLESRDIRGQNMSVVDRGRSRSKGFPSVHVFMDIHAKPITRRCTSHVYAH